jgi:dolichyl-phosphate-mannose--protein O-mannosyl transferase
MHQPADLEPESRDFAGSHSSSAAISAAAAPENARALQWSRTDTVTIGALLLATIATRFWRLGDPAAIVFDEKFTVSMARCYLSRLPYNATHPPLSSLLIASSIAAFGDQSISWRLPNAIFGTALVAVTYLLARLMFDSRAVAALAAIFVVCDGLFLVDSRIALWEIYYVTFAACAYLMLFRFVHSCDAPSERRALVWMGVAIGLCLASKLLIPVVTFLLVTGFVAFALVRKSRARSSLQSSTRLPAGEIASALALVGGLSGFIYLSVFIPHYWFGWWHGIGDQIAYYLGEFAAQRGLIRGSHPYASPWWSWPLMLRPIVYWFEPNFFNDPALPVAAIRALGNPLIWWGVLVAIPLAGFDAIARKDMARAFLVIGYIAYISMWIPIARYQFMYYYMPSLYLGCLALALAVVECWQGRAQSWRHAILLAPLAPALVLRDGPIAGGAIALSLAALYIAILRRDPRRAGMFASALVVGSVLVAFVYFFPVWTGLQYRTRLSTVECGCKARVSPVGNSYCGRPSESELRRVRAFTTAARFQIGVAIGSGRIEPAHAAAVALKNPGARGFQPGRSRKPASQRRIERRSRRPAYPLALAEFPARSAHLLVGASAWRCARVAD